MPSTCSAPSPTRVLADSLATGLRRELDLTPKPGLVDRSDNGSHPDLSYALMLDSIDLLAVYFRRCAASLEQGCGVERLRELGVIAEERMLECFGTNTHRGAIFLGGLLLAGYHRVERCDSEAVKNAVSDAARTLFATQAPAGTVGAQVRARFRAGGIVQEALRGLPSLFDVCVPALREARGLDFDTRHTQFLAMSRLMQAVEDTTALRRCGSLGLQIIRRDGARLESLLLHGEDPHPFLTHCNRRYRKHGLTMGGVADLLGVGAGWFALERRERRAKLRLRTTPVSETIAASLPWRTR